MVDGGAQALEPDSIPHDPSVVVWASLGMQVQEMVVGHGLQSLQKSPQDSKIDALRHSAPAWSGGNYGQKFDTRGHAGYHNAMHSGIQVKAKEAKEMLAKALDGKNSYVWTFRMSGDEASWKIPRDAENNLGCSIGSDLTREEAIEVLQAAIDTLRSS